MLSQLEQLYHEFKAQGEESRKEPLVRKYTTMAAWMGLLWPKGVLSLLGQTSIPSSMVIGHA